MGEKVLRGGRRIRLWAGVVCAALLAVWAVAAVCALGNADRILRGVRVEGVPLEGMDRQQAETALEEQRLPGFQRIRILFSAGGGLVAELTCGELGLMPDLSGAVEEALAVGRFGGSSWAEAFRRGLFCLLWRGEKEVRWNIQIDEDKFNSALPPMPRDARYDSAAGQVLEGTVGVAVDRENLLLAVAEAEPGGCVTVPVELIEPEVTAAELRAILFRDTLGTYRTAVSGTAARRENVRLSAAAIDGLVLESGAAFDFNVAVGERTPERGYAPAPSYLNGETVDTVGGGICQTSGTLYAAALLADLEILARTPHRYVSSYLPPGLDATVSWGGPEFIFRNTTDYPLRISAALEGEQLTVSLIGTKTDGTRVEVRRELLDTRQRETVCRVSDMLAPGESLLLQRGLDGCTVQTYRCLYDAAGKLLREVPEACSVYHSREEILLVGADPAPAEDLPAEDDPLPLRDREAFLP